MNNKQPKYIYPTPAGAYYLTQDNSSSWQKEVLKKLFSMPSTPELNHDTLIKLFDCDESQLNNKIEECKALKLIQVIDQPLHVPEGDLVNNLSQLLSVFSNKKNVLLSDSLGFCITHTGFADEMVEEISVLSADIAIMHKRRALEINKELGLKSQAWSIVDASGNSCLGFWPINIEEEVFVLAIEGVPFFNQPAMVSLVWMLYLRYGKK
jgi:hypothetical protein